MSTCTRLPSGVRFRTGVIGAVPLIDIPDIRSAVTKVIVGPRQHPKERAEGMRYLLAKHGMGHVDLEWTSSPLLLQKSRLCRPGSRVNLARMGRWDS